MVGTEAIPSGDAVHPPLDDAARAELAAWRARALERDDALRVLTRRPLVRLAVGLDRRLAPSARRLGAWRRRGQERADRIALRAAAVRAQVEHRPRQAALEREVARLGPAPSPGSVSVITLTGDDDEAGRRASADVAAATGDVLCFVPELLRSPDPAWMARLVEALGDDVVAATPTLVHPAGRGRERTEHDLLVRSEGFDVDVDDRGPVLVARGAGTRPCVGRPASTVAAAPLPCLAVDRRAFLAVGGLSDQPADDVAAVDLCARLRRHGGRVQHVPDALAFDARPVRSRAALRRPVDRTSPRWEALVDQHGGRLGHLVGGAPARTRWVITTAVPSARLAPRWGDWHLGLALARSLERLGEDVVVQTLDDAERPSTRAQDIHLVLHGLGPVRRTPGQAHVLWVISHPETLDIADCDEADLVLVASSRFAEALRGRTSTPVEVLLQATDPDRFAPGPVDPAHEHPVTVVAKSRNVRRAAVTAALDAGIRPAIYGGGWSDLVDPDLVVDEYVANEELPAVYRSAGIVLNDHWDTMRAWGFVSNRIFDVLACGTPVVSDDLPEVHELFGDSVPTYTSPAELAELVTCAQAEPELARKRAAEGRATVLAHHTFDHRAKALVELVELHGLRPDYQG